MQIKYLLLITLIVTLILPVTITQAGNTSELQAAGLITFETAEDGETETSENAEEASSESTDEFASTAQAEENGQPEGVSQLILLIGLGAIILIGLIMAGRERAASTVKES